MIDLQTFDLARFEASAADAAKLLRALANERRLMILCQLSGGERTVGALLPLIGVSQSALSQHLAVLRADGLARGVLGDGEALTRAPALRAGTRRGRGGGGPGRLAPRRSVHVQCAFRRR